MPMEQDPDKINDADRQIEAKVYKQAQDYAETRVESRELNERRNEGRKEIVKMGFRKDAYQSAIRIIKDLTPREQADYMRDLKTFLKILGAKQADLFPEEHLRNIKREEDRKQREKEAKSSAGRSPDHPRSDPKSGGAGKPKAKKDAKKSTGNVVPMKRPTEAAANEAAEQAEGEAVLSQSELAAKKLADAGIP